MHGPASTNEWSAFVRAEALLCLFSVALILCFACKCHSQQTNELNPVSFAIASAPSSLTIYPGVSGETAITVTNRSGLSGKVELTVMSRLPSGVSALLVPKQDGSIRLIFIAGEDAQVGMFTVTVAGTSGSASATTNVTLSVNAPTYVLSISPVPFTIARGSTFTSTASVVPWGNFAGTVNLYGYQLPAGVGTHFSPSSTNSTSVLTWTADNAAQTGSFRATIAGDAAGMTSYSQFQQIVTATPAPSFAVGVSPAYVTISQGATATAEIAVTESNGFKGDVSLSVTQLPAGIAATLNPDATSEKSVLTLSSSDSAAVGPTVISVWGSAAGLTSLSPLYVISQPALAFTLGVSPSPLTLSQGSSNTATIAVTAPSVADEDVSLFIASHLPTGIIASLTSRLGMAGALLTLTADESVQPGEYFLNLCGKTDPQSITITLPFFVEKARIVALPFFSLEGGTYSSEQRITISDSTPGAKIYFTTDGTSPTSGSIPYTGPIVVSSTKTIKAVAIASGYADSPVAAATYVITTLAAPVPEIEAMSPAFIAAAGAAFKLSIMGSGFSPGSTAFWGTSALATQFVDSTTLTAQVPTNNIATPGAFAVTVRTGGGISNSMQFEVDSARSTVLGIPVFSPATTEIYAGQTAVFQVTLPAQASDISVTCMNLPQAATCSYLKSANQLTIRTSITSPKGTFHVTVVINATLVSLTTESLVLPLFMMPFAFTRSRLGSRRILLAWPIGLALAATALYAIGCGDPSPAVQAKPPSVSTQQITSSGTIDLTIQ
jgi:hypothetical protein